MKPFHFKHLILLLKKLDKSHLPFDKEMSYYFRKNKSLGSKDRQLLSAIIYGMIRHKNLIQYKIKQSSIASQEAIDVFFDLKNIVLDTSIPLFLRLGCPKYLFSLLEIQNGKEKAIELCNINNTEAPVTIRVNEAKITREAFLSDWKEECLIKECEKASQGCILGKKICLTGLSSFKQGLFDIQDEGSQLLSDFIPLKKGLSVLDFCAGSGGKSLAISSKFNNELSLFLYDIRDEILLKAEKRLIRNGVRNFTFLSRDLFPSFFESMDVVIVDVPCSGTGTLRRNPWKKWDFSLKGLKKFQDLQRDIFSEAIKFVKAKGSIVYMTCSILKEENEDQAIFLQKEYNLILKKPFFSCLPEEHGCDGFFGVVFEKAG